MKDKLLPVAYVAACFWAAYWAFDLIGVHHDVVAGLDSGKCQDGGCGAVLQSEWSELFGIPVSIPAVPMFLVLGVLGLMAMAGKLAKETVSAVSSLATLGGLAFGGWLLFNMIYYVDDVCKFCLVMDASNVAVLVLGALLHPGGFVQSFKDIPGLVSKADARLPLGALAVAVVVLTPVLNSSTRPLKSAGPEVVVETPAPPAGTPSPLSVAPPKQVGGTTPPGPGRPDPGTRRLVLPAEIADIKLDASVPTKGSADAPVTLILFEDFQCPFCKKLSGNVEVLQEELGEDQLRVAFMHFPMHSSCNTNELKKNLHNFACNAAKASVCAQDQGKFWEMHDVLFRNNSRLRGKNLLGYAKDIGLDTTAWTSCMKSKAPLDKVIADSKVGGEHGVRGTPALFVNGRRLVGAQPVASLRAAVEAVKTDSTDRVLLDVALQGEVVGDVDSPAQVQIDGPEGPVTIDAFEASIADGKAVSQAGVEPARSVSWYEAKSACDAAGKRLCTEGEWLAACTGAVPIDNDGDGVYSKDQLEGRQHSYGEHWREGWCADSRKKTDPTPLITGNHPKCATPDGIYDLEGVTKEWVGLTPDRASLKGGSYFSGNAARCAYFKDSEAPDTKDDSIGFRCCSGDPPAALAGAVDKYPGGKVGDVMWDWSGKTADGGTLSMKDLKGKPVVMTFWASWCAPCKKELPALAEIHEQNKHNGLTVIGVNVDSDPAAARRYLAQNPLPFPVVMDHDKAIMDRFQTRGVPTTFWVKRDGVIRQRSVGYDDSAKGKVLSWVADLLAK